MIRLVRRPVRHLLSVLLVAGVLAGCSSGGDDTDPTATTAPPTVTATALAATVAPTIVPASGQIISDGVCQTIVPDEWIDNTTGSGTTTSGAKYALFGGRARTDDAWKQAVDLVKQQAGSRPGANVTETATTIRVDFADNRGFEYRVRLDTIYCDFTVTGTRAIPEDERALWDGIIAGLAPKAP